MYKPIYDKASGFKKIGEIVTWVFLLFLIPSTALGYFAEQSLPGQLLFPVKLSIEKVVLELQSFNPQAKASYQVDLVNKRFDEIQTLLTKDTTNADDLNNFGIQLQQATQYVDSLPPSPQKTALQQKLVSNIQTYQHQIKVQQQVVQNKAEIYHMSSGSTGGSQGIPNFTIPKIPPTATPTLIPNNNLSIPHFQNSPTPPPSYTPTPTPSGSQNYSSINQALQDMQDQLTTAQYDLTQNTFYFVTPTPTIQPSGTPTPTMTPSPTPTPTLIPSPTPTPYPQDYYQTLYSCTGNGGHCDTYEQANSDCKGKLLYKYSYPNSCTASSPICCPN